MRKMAMVVVGFIIFSTTNVFAEDIGDISIRVNGENSLKNNSANTNSNENNNTNSNENNNTNSNENNNTNSNSNALNSKNSSLATSAITTIDNSRSIGELPAAIFRGAESAQTPMNEYGHLDTAFSLQTAVRWTCKIDRKKFETMISVMGETEGAEEWDDINDKIIPSPIVGQKFAPLGNNEAVHFLNQEGVVPVLSQVTDENMVGLWMYNSNLDKKHPVLPPHFQVRAYEDAARLGANVIIPVDQFFQGYFVPEGFEFSAGGLLSWISKCFTNGQSVAAGAGYSAGKNTEFGRPGAAFVMLRVENPECLLNGSLCAKKVEPPVVQITPPPVPAPEPESCDPIPFLERIRQLEEGTKHCPNECLNNELLWKQIGDANMDLWYCTKDRKYLDCAIYAYWRSEKNFLEGVEGDRKTRTRDLKGAQDLVYWARYNCSLAIRERDGREQQISFAQEKRLGETGDGTMPTEQTDMKH